MRDSEREAKALGGSAKEFEIHPDWRTSEGVLVEE